MRGGSVRVSTAPSRAFKSIVDSELESLSVQKSTENGVFETI
jgi:hypothetical protein